MVLEGETELKEIINGENVGEYLFLSSGKLTRYKVDINKQTCECPGFKWRQNCTHLKKINERYGEATPTNNGALDILPSDGMDAVTFEEIIGSTVFKSLIATGEIWEQKGWVKRLE